MPKKTSVEEKVVKLIRTYGVDAVESVCLSYRLFAMPPVKKERKIKEVKKEEAS